MVCACVSTISFKFFTLLFGIFRFLSTSPICCCCYCFFFLLIFSLFLLCSLLVPCTPPYFPHRHPLLSSTCLPYDRFLVLICRSFLDCLCLYVCFVCVCTSIFTYSKIHRVCATDRMSVLCKNHTSNSAKLHLAFIWLFIHRKHCVQMIFCLFVFLLFRDWLTFSPPSVITIIVLFISSSDWIEHHLNTVVCHIWK